MKTKLLLTSFVSFIFINEAFAATTMSQEGQYIFNTLGFYLGGVLVAFMAAGFVCSKVVWLQQKVYRLSPLKILENLLFLQ